MGVLTGGGETVGAWESDGTSAAPQTPQKRCRSGISAAQDEHRIIALAGRAARRALTLSRAVSFLYNRLGEE